jgi:hypothetical protein
MPALTYQQIDEALGSYRDPSMSLMSALNQVLPRLYSMGVYRDLTIQYQLPIVDGCITLPRDAESVLFFQFNRNPSKVRSLWHDFKAAGMTGAIDPQIWGLVDAGYHPTEKSITEPVQFLYLRTSTYDVDKTPLNFADFSIAITATDGNEVYLGTVEHSSFFVHFPVPITQILSIRFYRAEGVVFSRIVDVRTQCAVEGFGSSQSDLSDPDSTIATLGPHSMVARYRRYRIPAAQSDSTAHVLVKRAFEPIVGEDDIVYMSSLPAIKHGLLALVAEDNADLERANFHWTEAQKNLELELGSSRGSAIPSVAFDIVGMEGRSQLHQML